MEFLLKEYYIHIVIIKKLNYVYRNNIIWINIYERIYVYLIKYGNYIPFFFLSNNMIIMRIVKFKQFFRLADEKVLRNDARS